MGLILPPVVSEALRPDAASTVLVWQGTQAEYDALLVKDANTWYMVVQDDT